MIRTWAGGVAYDAIDSRRKGYVNAGRSAMRNAYNQAVGRIAHLDKNSMHIVADVCFLHHSARADAL